MLSLAEIWAMSELQGCAIFEDFDYWLDGLAERGRCYYLNQMSKQVIITCISFNADQAGRNIDKKES